MDLTSAQRQVILVHADRLLRARDYPKTICPSEVARALSTEELRLLGAPGWRDCMDHVRSVVWQLREEGEVEVLQKGQVVDVAQLQDVRGPIRVRATQR
jgi:hypothetical protein